MPTFPVLMHTALDATDCRGLAEFYRQFLGLRHRCGDEVPEDGNDDAEWLVLLDSRGHRVLAFNQVPTLARSTWPTHEVPKQMHHDFRVSNVEELERHRRRAQDLRAKLVFDRSGEAGEPLYVLANLAGHPFCILVGSE